MAKTGLRIIIGIFIVIVFLVMGLGIYLSNGKTLQRWHAPSDFAEPFDYAAGSFEDYIAWSERRVRASRMDSPTEEEIHNLLPFVLEPDSDCPVNPDGKYPNGIVLVHGLIASPWSMKPLGDFFQSDCFYVLAVLLPGHGTRPGDMLVSHWEDWYRDLQFATRVLSEKAENIWLSGHSAGATLAVMEAARNPDVDSLVLFSPAMAVAEVSKYAGLVSQLGKIFPSAAWFELEPDDAVYRYESFPFTAAAETWALIRETDKALAENPLTIPVLTVASAQDTTVLAQATIDFMQAQTNPLSFTLLYAQHDLPPYARTKIVSSSDPDNGIFSVGHLGLMTPPDHPFYGRDMAYRYCGHYYGQPNDNFERCKAGERDFYAEPTEENLGFGLVERIAFNPFYNDMLDELELFIEQVSMDRRGLPLPPQIPGADPLDLDN